MLERFDTIKGTVVGETRNSTNVVSEGGEYRLRSSVPLLVGASGLFTVTGIRMEYGEVVYRVEPDSIEYDEVA